MADNITFEIVEHIGNLGPASESGWVKEINRVNWSNSNPAGKFDIRDWSPDHQKMSRGITLTDAEMQTVVELLAGRF